MLLWSIELKIDWYRLLPTTKSKNLVAIMIVTNSVIYRPFSCRPKTERSTSMVAPSKDLPRPRRNLRESAAAAATLKGKRSQRIRSASVGRDRRSDMQVGVQMRRNATW